MMTRISILALSILLFCVSPVYAATINVFGQSLGANTITGDEVGGITTITGLDVPVVITTLNEVGVSTPALFTFNAVSTAAATNVSGNLWTQPYDGSFSILSGGGFNYLSGDFAGVSLGVDGGSTLILGATQPPLSLLFTSDVAGMPLGDPTGMALAFTNAAISINNNSFGDFTSNVAGNFSATPVPEPASLLLLGSGLLALARIRRNKKV